MTLDEARLQIETWFKLGPQGNYAQAPTGESYVEVLSGGVKDEGEHIPLLCSSPELAVELWRKAMFAYAGPPDKGKTLYWRIPPEMNGQWIMRIDASLEVARSKEMRRMLSRRMYVVYSRVLVSDKPRIQPAVKSSRKPKRPHDPVTGERLSVQDYGYKRSSVVPS